MDNTTATDWLTLLVRLLGLVMLLIGLFIGIKVIFEAWHLYEEPQRIERFADAIEQGSHLNAVIASVAQKQTSTPQPRAIPPQQAKQVSLDLTYFLAWAIVIVLLMVIGSLAATAIRTGGQLALYDLQVKRFANQLLKQANHTK